MSHLCVSKLTTIGSDNGLSPDRRQAIICTNAGLLLIGSLGTNFSEILIEIIAFSLKKMRLKVSSAKRRPFCLGLNVLMRKIFICRMTENYTQHIESETRCPTFSRHFQMDFLPWKNVAFWFKFHWNMFRRAQLLRCQPSQVEIQNISRWDTDFGFKIQNKILLFREI